MRITQGRLIALLGNPDLHYYIVRIIDLSFALLREKDEILICYKLESKLY